MVQAAEDRPRGDQADTLDRPMTWRILAQAQMHSQFVVMGGVARKDTAQMGFADDNGMIEAFPADRPNQSLRTPVLPG